MNDPVPGDRRRLTRLHKEAVARLEGAHDSSVELRRQIATLPLAEQQHPAIQDVLRAIDATDVVYHQVSCLLANEARLPTQRP